MIVRSVFTAGKRGETVGSAHTHQGDGPLGLVSVGSAGFSEGLPGLNRFDDIQKDGSNLNI